MRLHPAQDVVEDAASNACSISRQSVRMATSSSMSSASTWESHGPGKDVSSTSSPSAASAVPRPTRGAPHPSTPLTMRTRLRRTHLSNSRRIKPGSVAPPLHGGGLAGFSRARANRIARPCGTLLPTIAAYLLVARSEPRPATRGTTSRPKDWKNRSLRLPSNENAGASPAAKRRGTRHARFISVTTTPANAA
jgi:hypothetical protein